MENCIRKATEKCTAVLSQCVTYTLPLECVILSVGANLREMGTDDGTPTWHLSALVLTCGTEAHLLPTEPSARERHMTGSF